jgi:hypothetical protein
MKSRAFAALAFTVVSTYFITGRAIAFPSAEISVAQASGDDQGLPPFLPPYYAPALELSDKRLKLTEHVEKDQGLRYTYASDDQVVGLMIESIRCDGATCAAVFDQGIKYFNTQATANAGQFRAISATEFRADWRTGLGESSSYVFKLPRSLLFWTYTARLHRNIDVDAYFERLKQMVNRQRYEAALPDNVEMGRWDIQIRDYARSLLKQGKKAEALVVLKNLLATSPVDYEAHIDFTENTSDRAAAKNSATVVYENAESLELISKAAHFLGVKEQSLASVPPLEHGERGLQLILIPLQPSDPRLLEEAGQVYEKITNVPVKIRRLTEEWKFGSPDRISNQRSIQQTIIQHIGATPDFTGWPVERYGTELMKTVEGKDALAKYWMKDYVDKLGDRQGQYRVDPYLTRFIGLLQKYRSDDARTMYVGVTEANIYAGDNNFVFSEFELQNDRGASILSYSVMLAKTLNEPYESRKRLAERMAKELVPASLKSLGIPRPADPTDPYSYSSGVDRLAQKTLALSAPTREALDKFR